MKAAVYLGVASLGVASAVLNTVVVSGVTASLPLLTGTAGSFTLPLAVIGVLKLAAAAKLAGVNILGGLIPSAPAAADDGGYPTHYSHYQQRHYRYQRSVENIGNEEVFGLVSSLDMYSCGKALVCSLRAKDQAQLAEDEALIMSLFSSHSASRGGPKAEYNLAAEYGALTKDQVSCQIRYQECPYTADQMMATLRASNL